MEKEYDICEIIDKELDRINRKIPWLAKQIRLEYSNLRKILKGKRPFSLYVIEKISDVLDLKLFYYLHKNQMIRKKKKKTIKKR